MIRGIQIAIFSIANGTNCFLYTGCFTTVVGRFINDITTADRLTLFPMVGFVGCPNRSGIMCFLGNGLTVFNLYITIAAIGIAGIAFFVAGSFLLILYIGCAFMII